MNPFRKTDLPFPGAGSSRTKLMSLCLLYLIWVSGCSKTDEVPAPSASEIFPLKTGNVWRFETVGSDSVVHPHVNLVTGDQVINGTRWYILTYDTIITTYCRNTAEGWWYLAGEDPVGQGTPSLYYRFPAKAGDQYMTSDSTLVKVVSTNARITVKAGTFSCYHYHMVHYLESYECEEYFAPGTGFIRHVTYAPGSGVTQVAETTTLVSFGLQTE